MSKAAPRRILVVDDEVSICEVLSIALRKAGHEVQAETSPRRALERIRREPYDIVIEDLKMPEMDGLDLLTEIKKVREETIVIIMTAYATWDRAVQAMRLGAYDYIRKPFDMELDIRATVQRALQQREQQTGTARPFEEILQEVGFIIGYSKEMKTVRDLLQRAATTDSTVLIQGESGVGKELVARALHLGSARAKKPFVAVNCGALTETLLESEMFGHARGSFTGAIADKVGLVQAADGGTLFLDEVSEMSQQLQVKVLRLLEEKEFKPVGSVQTRKVDVRFVAATNRNLEQEIKTGGFRKDLYYRLNVIPISVPSLRERRDDIPVLSEFFLQKYTKEMSRTRRFSPDAKEALPTRSWPGNVRELENAIQRAVALSESEEILPPDLFDSPAELPAPKIEAGSRSIPQEGLDLERELAEIEIGYLKQALERSDGNYTRAAQILRMSLRSFRYKLQKYGLQT